MQSMRFNLPARRFVSVLMAACICAFLLISTALPAFAGTNPTKGEDQLLGIERKSQEVTLSDPYSQEKTKNEANQGINEVQGDADKDKMKNPGNTNVTTFEDQVKDAVEKITNK